MASTEEHLERDAIITSTTAEKGELDFTKIYHDNLWSSEESRSGHGSTNLQTAYIQNVLPQLFQELGIKTLLDIPCGDFNWMQHVVAQSKGLIQHYIGGDIVKELITSNQRTFNNNNNNGHSSIDIDSTRIDFRTLNIVTSTLPKVDLVLVRDCLVHLPLSDAVKAIENIKRSGATYLLMTTFPEQHHRGDTCNDDNFICGMWRTLNMERSPFGFPSPLKMINEQCTESFLGRTYADKSLGLWALKDL